MKARLNLTIDDTLLEHVKQYASRQDISVSELVENYFKMVTRPSRRKNLLTLVDQLENPKMDVNVDLKDLYYQEKAEKYGL